MDSFFKRENSGSQKTRNYLGDISSQIVSEVEKIV